MTSLLRRAVALPVAALVTLSLASCSSGSPAPAQERVGAEPVVIGQDDVATPKEGRDYRVVTTLRGADARQATAVTDDGQILLTRYDHDSQTHFTLLDPRTGRRTKIPSPYHGTDVLVADAREVWYDGGKPMERPHVSHYDRRTKQVRSMVLPDAPGVSEKGFYRILGFVDDRVWFSTGRINNSVRDVWSVRFGRPGTVREEARNTQRPVLDDGVLAWTRDDPGENGHSYLVTRDLATGTTASAELPGDCTIGPEHTPWLNGEQVAVDAYCDGDDGTTVVADTSGDIEAILHVGDENGTLSISDRALFFFWVMYDTESRRAFEIWKTHTSGDANTPPASGPGPHPIMIWPRAMTKHEQFTRILVVRWK